MGRGETAQEGPLRPSATGSPALDPKRLGSAPMPIDPQALAAAVERLQTDGYATLYGQPITARDDINTIAEFLVRVRRDWPHVFDAALDGTCRTFTQRGALCKRQTIPGQSSCSHHDPAGKREEARQRAEEAAEAKAEAHLAARQAEADLAFERKHRAESDWHAANWALASGPPEDTPDTALDRIYRIGYGTTWKIGYSGNPGRRLADLQRHGDGTITPEAVNRLHLTLAATTWGGPNRERAIHRRLRPWHLVGEWFKTTDPAAEAILEAHGLGLP